MQNQRLRQKGFIAAGSAEWCIPCFSHAQQSGDFYAVTDEVPAV